MTPTLPEPSFLATRRGPKLTLALLCAVAFLDFLTPRSSMFALPRSATTDFTIQNLQWVLSGYVLTYGGFLLLGGRAADLPDADGSSSPAPRCLRSRRWLRPGPKLGELVAAASPRVWAQPMMSPAACRSSRPGFKSGHDRLKGAAPGVHGRLGLPVGVFLAACSPVDPAGGDGFLPVTRESACWC